MEELAAVKGNFLMVCQQYNAMGRLMQAFGMNPTPQQFGSVAGQHQHMGEQLKHLGASIDELGGPPVLQAEEGKEEVDASDQRV